MIMYTYKCSSWFYFYRISQAFIILNYIIFFCSNACTLFLLCASSPPLSNYSCTPFFMCGTISLQDVAASEYIRKENMFYVSI